MASIRNCFILLSLNLLYLNHIQSLSCSKKLDAKQSIENCDQSLNITKLRFLQRTNPFDLLNPKLQKTSKPESINKSKNDTQSCNSGLSGSSCRDERKVESGRFYSDANIADGKSNGKCGGVLNSPNGIVTSPNYPNPFNVPGECLWKIKTSDGSRLVVNLTDLELDSSLNCTQNVLIIYDGPTDQDSQLLVACNQKQLDNNLITSRGNELTIKLITNESTSYVKGFKFSYQTDCNNFIEGISGSIESPINQSSKSLNCSWTINVPKGNNISLVIEKFKSVDSSCSSSYLSFIGNQSTKTFCQSVDYTDFGPILITENQVQVNFVNLNPDNQSYFRLEWKLVGCGGDIHESEGELFSPNYPDSYPNGLNCLWTIHGKPSDIIKIFINEYHIEEGDSLQIFDGPSTRSHRLVYLAGRLLKRLKITSIRNQVTIFFQVDDMFNGKGLRLFFSTTTNDCHIIYPSTESSISSPSYPNRFSGPINCNWYPQDDFRNTFIQITFEDLDIPWSVNCTEHYVSLLNMRGLELDRFCGNSLSNTSFRSIFDNAIKIVYFSKSWHKGRGFKANIQPIWHSKEYIYGSLTELSHSAHQPKSENDENFLCIYDFVSIGSFNKSLLTFVDFAIKSQSGSYIELKDEGSNYPTRTIRYNSSSSVLPSHILGKSFKVSVRGHVLFKVLYSQYVDSCSYELNSWEGTFSSPEYPNDYPPSRTCVWKINLAPGNFISLKFHSFDIQYDQFCALDHLEIREENESGKLIGRFCGSNLPQLNSTQYYPSLWIRFKSHANGSASGFKASYKTIKDVKINSYSGKIGSFAYPRLFSSENNQSWIIKTSNFNKIKFKLESIDILDDSFDSSCTNSSVTIYDGPSVNSSILGQFCGYRTGDLPIYTTSSIAYVHFKPNFYISRFLLSWTSFQSDIAPPLIADFNHPCKYTANLKMNQNTSLLSSFYPDGVNCSWTISSPIGTQLQVEINEMDVKSSSHENCTNKNGVSFYDYSFDHQKAWKINRIVCDSKDKLFTLQGNQSLITFFNYSGSSTNLKGFNITVRPICGGTFYGPTGNIDSSLLAPFETCSWAIIVPKGQRVEIKFKSFNLGSYDDHCSNGYLSIRNDDSPNSRFIGHYCGSNLPKKIISASNQLFISTYVPASEQFEFSLTYRQVSTPCEFYVELNQSSPSAILQLPGYPHPPVEYSECDWVIKAPINRVIRIDFEIPDHDVGCNLNTTHIDIHDGSTQVAPKLGRFCPIARTTSVISSDNRMFIHFLSKGGTGSSSFKATVNLHICGGNFVVNGTTGIQSSSYPKHYAANMICNYSIYSAKMSEMLTYRLVTIDLPSNENCSSGDYLAIHEYGPSGQLLNKVCGTKDFEYRFSKTWINSLFMVFKSDSATFGKGFRIWFRYDQDDAHDHDIILGEPKTIKSPRYPDKYPVGRNITYSLTGPIDTRITLNFTQYNLKSADNLCLDKIIIYHHPDLMLRSTLIPKLEMTPNHINLPCDSNSTNLVIQSPNNRLIVYFETSSGLDAGQGFQAKVESDQPTECGGFIDWRSRSIISTNFSQSIHENSRISCAWQILTGVRDGKSAYNQLGLVSGLFTPWISFETIEVLGSVENDSLCSDGRITIAFHEVWGRDSVFMDKYKKIFCGKSSNMIVVSPFSSIFPNLISASFNRTHGYRGLKATYHMSQCGYTIDDVNGTIKTPGWPFANYPVDTVCLWTIFNEAYEINDQHVQIEFETFELEVDCSKDYVEIYEISDYKMTEIGRYCGKNKPPLIRAYRNRVSIVFRSDGDTTSKGFLLKFKMVKSTCGEFRTNIVNRFVKIPFSYKANQYCESLLEVDPPYRLNLTFVNRFDIEDSVDCSKDYLDINEWRNNSWHHFGRYCGYNSPGSIIFKENRGQLIFHSDGDDRRGDGFDYIVTKYCRMTIDKRGNGTIESPDYPNYYGINYCEWTFKGEEPNDTIHVHFKHFDLNIYEPCENNYLEVIKINRFTGEDEFQRYCPDDQLKDILIISQGNLRIISNSKKFTSSSGFTFDYRILYSNKLPS
ncbi:cubilin-like [Panonychus citri]|uniref:cubilin-like n=1 Tax=Panonychus citri TaxID=50023 RepID=UPI002306F52D|nr:cubilin-like [Panonychus citri]